MRARTDLWEPWGGNAPGPPGPAAPKRRSFRGSTHTTTDGVQSTLWNQFAHAGFRGQLTARVQPTRLRVVEKMRSVSLERTRAMTTTAESQNRHGAL